MDIPNANDARQGYFLSIDNAKRHFDCACILSQSFYYGPAASHMVLSAEESIKALILLILTCGFEFSESSIRPFFYSHQSRHAAGILLTLMNLLTDWWIKPITLLNNQYADKQGAEYLAARQALVSALTTELNRIADAGRDTNETLNQLLGWEQCEVTKQRGFYVDYRSQAWYAPSAISIEEFTRVKKIAEEALGNAERAGESFLSMAEEDVRNFRQVMSRLIEKR